MRILVHCHIFYSELWKELKDYILILQQFKPKIYFTMGDHNPSLVREIQETFPEAQIHILENRGYDIAPFISIINSIDLNDFDLIVKLHTKRNIQEYFHHVNYRWVYGKRWRQMLLAFTSPTQTLNKTLSMFRTDPTIGMIGNGNCWIDYVRSGMPWNSSYIEPELKRLKILTKERGFLSGTMFVCRAEIFKPIQHKIDFFSFPALTDHNTNLAHAYEMMFGVLVYEMGYRFSDYRSRPLHLPPMILLRKLFFRILFKIHLLVSP